MRYIILIFCLVLISGIFVSCSYGHKEFDQLGGKYVEPDDFVIQIDDYGKFWDPSVPDRALRKIASEASKTNTVVVLFVHGWHHNANINDSNAIDFSKTLLNIRSKIDDNNEGIAGPYRKSRQNLTGDGEVSVIGLYIGWRGKALPMPLNYLTFWNRKAAADRIGRGDLRTFLGQLQFLYEMENSKLSADAKSPFMGVVSIGHSFGAQVLFSAIGEKIEDSLIRAISNADETEKQRINGSIAGFGSISILINPAFEAMRYERISSLSKDLSFERYQTPLLLVLSSEGDIPRQKLFPIGRKIAAVVSKPSFRNNQKALWTESLGEYNEQRTHTITTEEPEVPLEHWFDPAIYSDNPCDIVNLDLAGDTLIGGMKIEKTTERSSYNPYIVAYTDNDIVINHNGIFEGPLRNFINDYTAISEGKRISLREKALWGCPYE